MLGGCLVGCVQPFDPAPTATPQGALIPLATTAVPTTPPVGGGVVATPETIGVVPTQVTPIGFGPQTIATWLSQNLGAVANNLTIFDQFLQGSDDMVGYTFQGGGGENCVGFVQATIATNSIWNGDYRCVSPGQVVGGSLIFALTNGEPYVATYGYIDPAAVPNAGGVSLSYPSGNTEQKQLAQLSFLILHAGLEIPTQLLVVDPNGNNPVSFGMPN
jgi:hypothetical protein